MTDVIAEFWWPAYCWETARAAVMFGINGPGEWLMVVMVLIRGPCSVSPTYRSEFGLGKLRLTLCAMLDQLTDKRTADDDFWIDVLVRNWWSEAYFAGADEMSITLKEASPHGYPYTKGVAEAREGQELRHEPPPRMDEELTLRDVEGAWTLCEQGLSLADDYPSRMDPLYGGHRSVDRRVRL